MRNKWAGWYSGLTEPQAYGDDQTYHMGERFLRGHSVEDWGCGKGYFSIAKDYNITQAHVSNLKRRKRRR